MYKKSVPRAQSMTNIINAELIDRMSDPVSTHTIRVQPVIIEYAIIDILIDAIIPHLLVGQSIPEATSVNFIETLFIPA